MATCEQKNYQKYWNENRNIFGSKPKWFKNWKDGFATEAQMAELDNLLVELYGTKLFNFKSIEDYISGKLIELGRTKIDLKKEPITKYEAEEMITELKRMRRIIRQYGSWFQFLKHKIATPEKVLIQHPVTRHFFEEYQKEMSKFVKRKITIWMELISPEKPGDEKGVVDFFEYKKDENGKPLRVDGVWKINKKFQTTEISHLLGFEEEYRDTGKTERELLKEWVKLQYEAAPVKVLDENYKPVVFRDEDAVKRLEKFEQQYADLIAKAKFFKQYIETGKLDENPGIPEGKLRAAKDAWNAMMDDVYVFDVETVERWLERKSKTGKTYKELLQNELRKRLKVLQASNKKLTDEKIKRLVNLLYPSTVKYLKNYFPRIGVELNPDLGFFADEILKDIETGRVDIDTLLSKGQKVGFWFHRTGEEKDIILDPLTVAEIRVMASIQARKNMALRALYNETIELLRQEQDKLFAADDSKMIKNKKEYDAWIGDTNKYLKALQALEDYVRLLAADSSGVPRNVSKVTEKIMRLFVSPENIDETVRSMSRAYRALKVAALLGFSMKSAMVNLQQSVGPVAVEFGFKNMFNAQRDMGFLGIKSKRGTKRVIITQSGESITVDVPELVGIKYDDIMSLMERGLPRFDNIIEAEIKRNKYVARWAKEFERWMQKTAQTSLEYSILGRLINFVDIEYRNRAVTSLAAYDYMMDKLTKRGIPEWEAHNKAIAFARKMVNKLQFEYSVFNRPEFLRGNLGSSVFLFKSFTVNQTQMQWDWVYDLKANVFRNERGMYIPYEKVARFARASIFAALNMILKHWFKFAAGILIIESPLIDYISNFMKLIFGDDKDKEEAFYGLSSFGAFTYLISGPFSDLANILMVASADDYFKRRSSNALWDGFVPGGRTIRRLYNITTADENQRKFFINKFMMEQMSLRPVYERRDKILFKGLNKNSGLKKLEK